MTDPVKNITSSKPFSKSKTVLDTVISKKDFRIRDNITKTFRQNTTREINNIFFKCVWGGGVLRADALHHSGRFVEFIIIHSDFILYNFNEKLLSVKIMSPSAAVAAIDYQTEWHVTKTVCGPQGKSSTLIKHCGNYSKCIVK